MLPRFNSNPWWFLIAYQTNSKHCSQTHKASLLFSPEGLLGTPPSLALLCLFFGHLVLKHCVEILCVSVYKLLRCKTLSGSFCFHCLALCYWKCGPWPRSLGITWELVWICVLAMRSPRDSPYGLRSWLVFWMQLALTEYWTELNQAGSCRAQLSFPFAEIDPSHEVSFFEVD